MRLHDQNASSIPAPHRGRHIYHFTHISNLKSIFEHGFLAKNHPENPGTPRSVAAEGIQARRRQMDVPCGPGGVVHDYVPLYFGALSPMLLSVINTKNVDQYDIVYFEFPIKIMESLPCVFTDASANTDSPPNFYDDLADLVLLDWMQIDSPRWGSESDTVRHKRMAEALVHQSLDFNLAKSLVVWNEHVKKHVENLAQEQGIRIPPVEFGCKDRHHWFLSFMTEGRKKASLVAGPGEVRSHWNQFCQELADLKPSANRQYRCYGELVEALATDFCCLPQTKELNGLYAADPSRSDCMAIHTQKVVAHLKDDCKFMALPKKIRTCVQLAAFLHDIGKGPKSRWAKTDGKYRQDLNHPILALPMILDIHSSHLGAWAPEEAMLLAKLVCYHDLVGDILARGRDQQQLLEVADNQQEIDLLFMLGKADVMAVPLYWNEGRADELYEWAIDNLELRQ